MTMPQSLARIDAYWSETLGVDVTSLSPERAVVVAHGKSLDGYNGIYALAVGDGCTVSAPATRVEACRGALAGLTAVQVFDADLLVNICGEAVEQVIGPASLSYADASDIRPVAGEARMLTPADTAALRDLQEAAGEPEWLYSGIEFERTPIFGRFEGTVLTAAASYQPWGDDILHLGVVTHPAFRRRGHGRDAASAAAADGLRQGRIMQWQTLLSNVPSISIARGLGFVEHVRSIAVRLLDATPA
jgi:RimJ/RimL family protein N-acetyltransferase